MYSDFQCCRYCCDVGLYVDGDNYCKACASYLCLTCSRTHGRHCKHLQQTTPTPVSPSSVDSYIGSIPSNNTTPSTTREQNGVFLNYNNELYNGVRIVTSRSDTDPPSSRSCYTSSAYRYNESNKKPNGDQIAMNTQLHTQRKTLEIANTDIPVKRQQLTPANTVQQKTRFAQTQQNVRRSSFTNRGGVIRITNAWADTDLGQQAIQHGNSALLNRPASAWNETISGQCVKTVADNEVTHSESIREHSTSTVNGITKQDSFIIGDVIISQCCDPSAHVHERQEYVDSEGSISDDDEITMTNRTDSVSPGSSLPRQTDTVTVKHKIQKDKIKTYGLATEYHMSDSNNSVNEDLRILRLLSPTPRNNITIHTDSEQPEIKEQRINDAAEVAADRNRHLIQWQDKKLLQSVEVNSNKKPEPNNTTRSITKRPKKIFESSENELRETMINTNIDKQKKTRHLQKVRKENIRVIPNSTKHKNSPVKTKGRPCTKYELETDANRLKKWIKQTEDMNKVYAKTQNGDDSTRTHVNSLATDGITEVLLANADNLSETGIDNPPIMSMKMKNAKVLKHTRVSSAKSQTSDEDESKHKRQTYACRPSNTLSIFAEHDVRLPNDKVSCKINGVSCMPDGRIAVTDYNNSNIKLFRVGWSKGSVLALEEPPHDVAVVNHTLMSVIAGLAFDRIYLVSVGQCMAMKRRFKTGCVCKAVSSYQSYIYLLCLHRYNTEVRVLNIDGVVSVRFALGHTIPSPVGIAVNQLTGMVSITDKTEGVFVCESGQVVSRSFDSNIGEYQQVACDSGNNVYVTTANPSGIYEVSKNGKHLMPVVLGSTLREVSAMSYNEALNCFVVCFGDTSILHMYRII